MLSWQDRQAYRRAMDNGESIKSRWWLKMVISFPETSSTPHFFCLGGGLRRERKEHVNAIYDKRAGTIYVELTAAVWEGLDVCVNLSP